MWGDHLRAFGHAKTRHARADDESRNLGATVVACARAREDGVEVGDAGVGDKPLAAVNNVSVVFAARRGLETSHVRTRVGFS